MKKSLIVVITPTPSHPRFQKRISALSKLSDIIVFSFKRGLYEVNAIQSGIKVVDLGLIPNRNYIKRIFPLIMAVYLLFKNLPRGYKTIQFYTFSIDCLLLAKLVGIKVGFFEVGDLHILSTTNKWFRSFEKIILGHIKGLVLTSKEYLNQYYKSLIRHNGKPTVFIIENRLPPSLKPYRIRNKTEMIVRKTPIIIGLIGLLRYEIPIIRLLNYVNENPELVVLKIFGDGPCKQLISEHLSEIIQFYGSFKNPDELPKIYNEIDLNYVVYDNRFLNVKLAIPNKLYESAFFQVPLICSPNTYLSRLTKEWGIGGTVRIDTQKHFNDDMKRIINIEWINSKSFNCSTIPNSEIVDDQVRILKTMFN